MKVLIITYLNSLSPGTFLQAYGVQKGLKQKFPGSVIYYLNAKDITRTLKSKKTHVSKLNFIKQKLYGGIRYLQLYYLQKKYYKIIGEKIDLFNYNEADVIRLINEFDLLVIGSDTILEKIYGSNGSQIGIMWPDERVGIKKIYFAASAAPGNFVLNNKIKSVLKERIEKFAFIGLRDDITLLVFQNILGKSSVPLVKQPDPTYFINLSEFTLPFYYRHIFSKQRKYCLFTFNSQFQYRNELSKLLKDYGYTLVSAQYIPEADISLATLNPLQWGSIFKYCDLIVTERFHDTLFALRNCKPVITIDWDEERISVSGESKTKSILTDYDLDNHHVIIRSKKDLQTVHRLIEKIALFDPGKINEINKQKIDLSYEILRQIENSIVQQK
jgi:hypothetical protein